MKKVNVNELSVVSVVEMENIFMDDFSNDIDSNDVVIEVMVGCRGIVDEIKKVDVRDDVFFVKSEDEIKGKKMYVEGWYEESVSYFVRVK